MSAATATPSPPLAQTLLDRFGHEGFRRGQKEAVEALVQEQRDVAVFWATGGGKSLCYQLPALHAFDGSKAGLPQRAQGIVVVVSPLISLMQDQVRALNATVRKDGEEDIACFLGSSQPDPNVLSRAVAGMYALVYVSPEKLLSFGLMDELIQRQTRVLAFAIDEAHCICEWGADFRREYAQLGRIREVFPNTPIMALTATASPRVRADIVEKLKLRAPLTCKGSFDRPNLEIAVKSRPALARAANEIAADFRKRPGPSIIYCATRKLVEEMAAALGSELGPDHVRRYHAGLSDGERSEAHGLFITGQISIVVATVAFGMGIDKPDVRRVIHYGPPKTMEAYVQQIGRAGRDGLPSQCVLYFQEQDFINYGSDFYVSGLSPEQRQAVEASTQKLRNFSRRLQCRRYQLLKAFEEEDPSWGTECGTCDVCRMPSKKLVMRDYTEPARLLMSKIYSSGSAWTHIQKRIEPGAVKGWSMPKLRKLLEMLAAEGFVGAEECKVKLQNGFNNTFVKYSLLPAGRAALQTQEPVLLTPSMFLLDLEKEDAMAHNKRYDEIRALGLNPDLIPTDQIHAGKGPVYDAFLHWTRTLKRYEEVGKLDTVRRLQDMKAVIEEWRRLEAVRTGTPPATVIPDYVVCKVAYTRPTSVDALRSAGVRSANIGDLAKAIEAASARLGFDAKRTAQSAGMDDDDEEVVVFPEGPFSPPKRWRLATSADERKAWFATCLALQEGDTLVNIALNGGKKPRQVATIASHALTGIEHGLKLGRLDLHTLARELDVQRFTKSEWTDLNAFTIASGMDPAGHKDLPSEFKSKFARHFLGDDLVNKAFQDRTPEEKAKLSSFYTKLNLWMTLRRVGFEPSFAPAREANKKSKCL